jgi:ribosome-associated protein
MTLNTMDSSLEMYINAVSGKKALRLIVLDLRGIATFTDAFIICSGRSNRQVTAIAEHIEAELKKQGKRPLSVEGVKEGHWALLDYGDMVIHVFYESVREFYNLEGLWTDAKKVNIEHLLSRSADEPEDELYED